MISVIMPTYNAARYIKESIESVLSQKEVDLELIVIDDGSTDNTETVCCEFGDRIRYIRQKNGGPSAARNHGIELAKGQYIAFCDSDDLWLPNKLMVQLKLFQTFPDIDAIFTNFIIFNDQRDLLEDGVSSYSIFRRFPLRKETLFENQNRSQDGKSAFSYGDAFSSLLKGNFILTSTLVFKKGVLQKTGVFDLAFQTQEDWEFFLRLSQKIKIGYLDEPFIKYRRRENQLTNDHAGVSENVLKIIQKYMSNDEIRKGHESLLKYQLQYYHRHYGINLLAQKRRIEARRHFKKSIYYYPYHPIAYFLFLLSSLPTFIACDLSFRVKRGMRRIRGS